MHIFMSMACRGKLNPTQFIDAAAECISRSKRRALVDGIEYRCLGDGDYYAQELFEHSELTGDLTNVLDVKKSVHKKVVYDSAVEKQFAQDLEMNVAVRLYAKLPGWFMIATPLGRYNPDWAVVVDVAGEQKLFFVVETKGSLFDDALRENEGAKIKCGGEHFAAIGAAGCVLPPTPQHVPVGRSHGDRHRPRIGGGGGGL